MTSKARFLSILWAFVACDFVLFQNFTQNGSSSVLHNDLCKQSLDLNDSRILQVKNIEADLLAAWPKSASTSPENDLKSMMSILLDSNKAMYDACVTNTTSVRDSHLYALDELGKLADPGSNSAWKNYVGVIESALDSFKKDVL